MTPFLPEARGATRPEGPRSLRPESTLKVSISASPCRVLPPPAAVAPSRSVDLFAAGTLPLLLRLKKSPPRGAPRRVVHAFVFALVPHGARVMCVRATLDLFRPLLSRPPTAESSLPAPLLSLSPSPINSRDRQSIVGNQSLKNLRLRTILPSGYKISALFICCPETCAWWHFLATCWVSSRHLVPVNGCWAPLHVRRSEWEGTRQGGDPNTLAAATSVPKSWSFVSPQSAQPTRRQKSREPAATAVAHPQGIICRLPPLRRVGLHHRVPLSNT